MPTSIPSTSVYKYGRRVRKHTQAILKYNTVTGYSDVIGYETTTSSLGDNLAMAISTSKSSVSTPGYHKLVKQGQMLPANPFSYTSVTTIYGSGNVSNTIKDSRGQLLQRDVDFGPIGYIPSWPLSVVPPSDALIQNCVNDCIIKVRLKLKDAGVNVALVVAEREKTVQMVIKAATTIAQALMHLKKGDLSKVQEAMNISLSRRAQKRIKRGLSAGKGEGGTQAVSSAWLELQYGWKPLLNDVKDAAISLSKIPNRPIIGSVKAVSSINGSNITKVSLGGNGNFRTHTDTYHHRVVYSVQYMAMSPVMPGISALGLTNPLSLAWELVPFSFIVDWFVPIGDWLSSFDATVGLAFISGTVSHKKEYQRLIYESQYYSSGSSLYEGNLYGSIRENSILRSTLNGFPFAPYPPFKNPASLTHMANAIALLRLAASGKK